MCVFPDSSSFFAKRASREFIFTIVTRVVASYGVASVQLKVVVMSASLAVEHFVAYFRSERLLTLRSTFPSRNSWQQPQQKPLRKNEDRVCSSVMTLKVPGRTFPVSVHFLSDVLRMCEPESLPSFYQKTAEASAATAARYKGRRLGAVKTDWRDQQQDSFAQTTLPICGSTAAAAAALGSPAVALPQLPQLVAAVVRHIHLNGTLHDVSSRAGDGRGPRGDKRGQQRQQQNGKGTAIIVFCCGMGEVSSVCRALEELQMDLWVLPCHASLHPAQQQKVRHCCCLRCCPLWYFHYY